jgi:hypothetical protein
MACQSPDNLLYLHSLPESSSFDALPRRWDDNEIRDMLAGTTLLEHVKATKKGVFEDYNMMLQQHQNFIEKKTTTDENVDDTGDDDNDMKPNGTSSTNMAAFPSFEIFSDMLAAVTSRAFQIDDSDDDVALVPILDLGNHTRGKATTKFGRKNVSYQYDKTEGEGFMIVQSTIDIDAEECIRLTYGAKSNDQLLLNYGFCIPRNIEPDGSSNDVLNFQILSDNNNSPGGGKIIALRAGPKSYSYGGFAATLEEFLNETDNNNTGMEDNNNEDVDHNDVSHEEEDDDKPDDIDFEDFLNQCDNDNEGETGDNDDFIDLYDVKTDERMDDSELLANSNPSIKKEMEALKIFKQNLIKMSECYNSYKGTDIETLLSVKSGYPLTRMYSTILSLSELRTIYFFVRAIDKVQQVLHPNANSTVCTMDIITDQEDLDMIEKQTTDLANAYMAIRRRLNNYIKNDS